jgi:ubiquinone biosynthesis monooxygenase Coq7
MWDQEKEHKEKFEELIPKYRARPTALLPIWNVAGWVLGAGNSFLFKLELRTLGRILIVKMNIRS